MPSATSTPAPTRTPTATPTPSPTATPTGPIYPLAVMVENMIDARPQSGLAKADVVYEALVEGGITRFMAVYKDGKASEIGPVRSARHYYVYLAAEFNAAYVHIGASPQGYVALDASRVTNLDETYGDPGFWRSDARYAPHNAYTSTDLLRQSLDKVRELSPGSMAGFKFGEQPKTAQGTPSYGLTIYYPGGYEVGYGYSPETKSYLRSMDGLPHRDADSGERVSPLNVVVQVIRSWTIDDIGRLDMEQVGQGKALFFRDGVVSEGSWHKRSLTAPTQWLDANDTPVLMKPGKIWVQMIPPGTKMEY
ncbi:MAG TPA: DUF3048 domain-containing protein [Chloroflexota bacterium]|nr:DUF3048 domain-containing protein [Chloroflexota bacterium]